jgi:hypothetical protein
LAQRPFAALVNVALPSESFILMAPLAAEAGGWGLFPAAGWRDTADQDYLRVRQLVEASIAPLDHRDIAGTCGREDHCACDSCWVRLKNVQDRDKALTKSGPPPATCTLRRRE